MAGPSPDHLTSTAHSIPPDAATQSITIGREHLKAMVDSLEENRGLFDLPQSTLELLQPFFRDSVVEMLKEEFLVHMELYGVNLTRYGTEPDDYFTQPLRDLEFLKSIPNGIIPAIDLLPLLSREQFLHSASVTKDDWYEWFSEDAEEIDKAGHRWLQELLQGDLTRLQREELEETFEQMDMECRRRKAAVLEGKKNAVTAEEKSNWSEREPLPVFRKCLELLRAWRSMEAGAMLAMKVAGHLLPPELVELIADCFYDPEPLKVSDEAPRKANGSD